MALLYHRLLKISGTCVAKYVHVCSDLLLCTYWKQARLIITSRLQNFFGLSRETLYSPMRTVIYICVLLFVHGPAYTLNSGGARKLLVYRKVVDRHFDRVHMPLRNLFNDVLDNSWGVRGQGRAWLCRHNNKGMNSELLLALLLHT